jgi:N-acetylglucosaminyldiphosphoundecaprenol N-acetyl-beta-D-mannosaminyltransferase
MAYKEPSVRAILRKADLWVPDGIAPVWVARLRWHRGVSRVPGAELMDAFFAAAQQQGYRSFFYGDTSETLQELTTRVAVQFPRHKIAGTFSPPFRPLTRAEDERIIRRINDSGADVLWVGLGLPKQERWIFERRSRLRVPVAVGVGAAFGFLSQKVRRCPRWVGESGFEWAYRFLMEPKRLWRRDLLDGPRFLTHLALELFGLRKYD